LAVPWIFTAAKAAALDALMSPGRMDDGIGAVHECAQGGLVRQVTGHDI